MSLVLSYSFKGILLSSYVNIKYDFTIKSMKKLKEKSQVEIINYGYTNFIKRNINNSPEIIQLKERLAKNSKLDFDSYKNNIIKLQSNKAVILCELDFCQAMIHIWFNIL